MTYTTRDAGVSISTPDAADTLVNTAVDDLLNNESVDAIIGGLRSSKSIAIAKAHGGDVAQVSPASTSRSLSVGRTDDYPGFFRVII